MPKTYTTKNANQTRALAAKLAKTLKGGETIALTGDLGAGKTTFIKGLARALGITETITSPTFVLMKKYETAAEPTSPTKPTAEPAPKFLFHADAYRLSSAADLDAIGLTEAIKDPESIVVIEWADRVPEILPPDTIKIDFQHTPIETERKITITR